MAKERNLTEPHPGDKRYVRRDDKGQFTDDQVDVGRSRSREAKQAAKGQRAKVNVPKGQGDEGDRPRS